MELDTARTFPAEYLSNYDGDTFTLVSSKVPLDIETDWGQLGLVTETDQESEGQ